MLLHLAHCNHSPTRHTQREGAEMVCRYDDCCCCWCCWCRCWPSTSERRKRHQRGLSGRGPADGLPLQHPTITIALHLWLACNNTHFKQPQPRGRWIGTRAREKYYYKRTFSSRVLRNSAHGEREHNTNLDLIACWEHRPVSCLCDPFWFFEGSSSDHRGQVHGTTRWESGLLQKLHAKLK